MVSHNSWELPEQRKTYQKSQPPPQPSWAGNYKRTQNNGMKKDSWNDTKCKYKDKVWSHDELPF